MSSSEPHGTKILIMVGAIVGNVLLCFHGPILTMVSCFAGDDKQLLVQGEGECVQATQGRERSGV
jgi:hypothetical protein